MRNDVAYCGPSNGYTCHWGFRVYQELQGISAHEGDRICNRHHRGEDVFSPICGVPTLVETEAPSAAPTRFGDRGPVFGFAVNGVVRQIRLVVTNDDPHVLKVQRASTTATTDYSPYLVNDDGDYTALDLDNHNPEQACAEIMPNGPTADWQWPESGHGDKPDAPSLDCATTNNEVHILVCNRVLMGVYHPSVIRSRPADATGRVEYDALLPSRSLFVYRPCRV